jgi:uncharacterized repeat protein (TIGR03803 family)
VYGGGAFGFGAIFRITPTGDFSILHSFDSMDGARPGAALIQASDGDFYGTTQIGGTHDFGTVFKITANGALTTLHTFNSSDGAQPVAPLIQTKDGILYGTTATGGTSSSCPRGGCGTIFQITTKGKLTTLHSFVSIDGGYPAGALAQDSDGNTFSTTTFGGGDRICPQGCGTIFAINSRTVLDVLHDFDLADGEIPEGGLFQATNGTFYGTSFSGGGGSDGTIFSLDMGLPPFITFVSPTGKVGQTTQILGQGLTGTSSVTFNGMPATSF